MKRQLRAVLSGFRGIQSCGSRYTSAMRFRFSDGDVEDLNSASDNSDDQRTRPRSGTIEKIADIAYDALRKHEITPDPPDQPQDDSR